MPIPMSMSSEYSKNLPTIIWIPVVQLCSCTNVNHTLIDVSGVSSRDQRCHFQGRWDCHLWRGDEGQVRGRPLDQVHRASPQVHFEVRIKVWLKSMAQSLGAYLGAFSSQFNGVRHALKNFLTFSQILVSTSQLLAVWIILNRIIWLF